VTVWAEHEIDAWCEAQRAERDAKQAVRRAEREAEKAKSKAGLNKIVAEVIGVENPLRPRSRFHLSPILGSRTPGG
jgi:hypothetical protein